MPQYCKPVADSGDEQSFFEDETLEAIWETRERGDEVTLDNLFREVGHKNRLDRMHKKSLFTVADDGKITLGPQGETRARDIIRRHRLAERLFADVLDLKNYEEDACRLEHALSPEVEQAICTLLGHPPRCPHGKPIPKGECCAVFTRDVKPLSVSMRDMNVGTSGRVLFITGPAMDRLATMGIVPGVEIRLNQRKPSYVVEVDETTVAIDEEIATGIYIKQL